MVGVGNLWGPDSQTLAQGTLSPGMGSRGAVGCVLPGIAQGRAIIPVLGASAAALGEVTWSPPAVPSRSRGGSWHWGHLLPMCQGPYVPTGTWALPWLCSPGSSTAKASLATLRVLDCESPGPVSAQRSCHHCYCHRWLQLPRAQLLATLRRDSAQPRHQGRVPCGCAQHWEHGQCLHPAQLGCSHKATWHCQPHCPKPTIPSPTPLALPDPLSRPRSPNTDWPPAQPRVHREPPTHSSCSPGQPRPVSAPPTRPSASSGTGPAQQLSCCQCTAARAGCSSGALAVTSAQGDPGTQPQQLPPPPEPPALHQGCKVGAHLSAKPPSAPQSCHGVLEGAAQSPTLPRGGQRMLPTPQQHCPTPAHLLAWASFGVMPPRGSGGEPGSAAGAAGSSARRSATSSSCKKNWGGRG